MQPSNGGQYEFSEYRIGQLGTCKCIAFIERYFIEKIVENASDWLSNGGSFFVKMAI